MPSKTEWRERETENNSDEDSGLTSRLNGSDTSTSTQIVQTQQNPETLNLSSPINQELEKQLSNLKLNETKNHSEVPSFNGSEEQLRNTDNNDQEINMQQARNAGIGPIHQSVKNLPYFDGNPKMLKQFITSLQYLSESYGAESDQ